MLLNGRRTIPRLIASGLLWLAMVIAYGQAQAAEVTDMEPNDTVDTAQSIDGSFTLDPDENIFASTVFPHATVQGTGNDTFDYYSFTVSAAGVVGIFDIDFGSCAPVHLMSIAATIG